MGIKIHMKAINEGGGVSFHFNPYSIPLQFYIFMVIFSSLSNVVECKAYNKYNIGVA
jgi:hypothetical protein